MLLEGNRGPVVKLGMEDKFQWEGFLHVWERITLTCII